jgi:hypothetical protein
MEKEAVRQQRVAGSSTLKRFTAKLGKWKTDFVDDILSGMVL